MKLLITCLIFIPISITSAKTVTAEDDKTFFDCNGQCANSNFLKSALPDNNLEQLGRHITKKPTLPVEIFCGELIHEGNRTTLMDYAYNPYYFGDPEESLWAKKTQDKCVCIKAEKDHDKQGFVKFGKNMYQAWDCTAVDFYELNKRKMQPQHLKN